MQDDLNKPIFFVLHRKPYRETSHLLDLFSEKHGRFSALHRINKKNPPLQPFIPYQMQLSGRGHLKYCQNVETSYDDFAFNSESLKGLELKGKNLYCGFYLNELLVRLTWKDEPQPEIFNVYRQTLIGLLMLENDYQSEPLLRRFEFHLLSILGYQYNWQQDDECRNIEPKGTYRFDPASGFKRMEIERYGIDEGGNGSVAFGSSNLSVNFPGDALLAIANNDWAHPLSWQVAKQIARLALEPLLGGKPLTSRALFQRV